MKEARTVLADVFFMYLKAHIYHWNVEGINFPQMHEFFGNLYEELHGSIDPLAEHIRALGEYTPRNIEEMYNDKTVDCLNTAVSAKDMVADLSTANTQVIASLNNLFKQLESNNKQGFMNYVADRLDQQEKHGWMLRSILKNGE